MWAVFFLIQVGLNILQALLRPKPKPEKKPDIPETSGDAPIQVPFGTCLINGGELLDYFDYKAVPIKVRSIATLWIIAITVGYRYYLGIVWALCWGKTPQTINGGAKLLSILIDGRKVVGEPGLEIDGEGIIIGEIGNLHQATPGYIYKPTFFGSEKQEGGIITRFVYYTGMDLSYLNLGIDLIPDAYWQQEVTKRDATVKIPHYLDLMYLVWYGPSSAKIDIFHGGGFKNGKLSGCIGNSNRLWPVAFKVQRIPACLGGGPVENGLGTQPTISGPHANPISCLYESFINKEWGLGLSADELDADSFYNAAFTCWQEGLGWSYLWTNASPIIELQNEILTFVSGTVYSDRQSQKIKVVLSRGNYNVEDLPHLTNNNFLQIDEFLRPGWASTKNELRLTFTDQSTPDFKAETAYWQELANKQARGETVAEEMTMLGCPAMDEAQRLADREGRVIATPLATLTGITDRTCWNWHRGKVFILDWPEEGIEGLVMRVTGIRFGTPTDPGIRITAVEDVFRAGEAIYGEVNTTTWTDPVVANLVQAVVAPGELPYYFQRDSLVRVFEVAQRPNAAHIGYDGAIDVGGETNVDFSGVDFTPYGKLINSYPQLTSVYDTSEQLVLNNLKDPDNVEAGSAAQIASAGAGMAMLGNPTTNAHEWIAFESADYDENAGTLTLNNVWRGLLDTTPMTWPAETAAWFFAAANCIFSRTLTSGQAVSVRAVVRTGLSAMRPDQATPHAITTVGRANRPIPPAYVRLGGSYTNERQDSGDLVFTWLERNRLTTPDAVKQDAATIEPESGITYEVDIYGPDDVLNNTVTGLTDPTFTYTNAQEETDFGELQVKLTLKFYSVRDGLRSFTPFVRRVFRVDPESFGNAAWVLPPQVFGFARASVDVTDWDEVGVEVYAVDKMPEN